MPRESQTRLGEMGTLEWPKEETRKHVIRHSMFLVQAHVFHDVNVVAWEVVPKGSCLSQATTCCRTWTPLAASLVSCASEHKGRKGR